ncbi:DUF4041 domain-containing protein [Heyndrickxia sp. FSL K6-6286]|uniref:DUF4041 domain-containing protein n=1 Tax=Heyndrickxia sp. FSL K6-6286 TaxID=2921510 RepID=UPI00315999F9
MKNSKWYLSSWFICILFSLWFLIIPLIFGLILLFRQRRMIRLEENLTIKELFQCKEKELAMQKESLEQRENQIAQKQKELVIIALTQQLRTMAIGKAEKEKFMKYKASIEKQEKNLEIQVVQKQKEIWILTLTQQLRMIAMVAAKQKELSKLETSIFERKQRLKEIFKRKHKDIEKLNSKIKFLKRELIKLEDESLYQSFGFYDKQFDFDSSEEYSKSIELVRQKQKDLVRQKIATKHHSDWTLNGSSRKGSAQNNQNIKIAIRSFNHECDYIISKVKFNNVEIAEKKIRTEFYKINKLNRYNLIEISEEYLNLKVEELFLVYEYIEKKQEEKEEQRRIKELLREERRAQKELEEELKKIRKEEQHLLNVISQLSSQISEQEMFKYKNRLSEIREQIEQVDYRVKNTKAGYVYVISNIGCFGENVYKIGMTRRLDPLDRVRELGGASVPFHFDIHAVIFSEDAPALEASLHRAFHHRRVNRINQRKEFFKVDLADIKKVVYQSHNKPVKFKIIAEAKEFRETKELEKKLAKQHII